MSYPSVDQLQKILTEDVFHYAKDAKKAAGRALGTLVEIITFHLVKSWGLERHVAIETRLPEYGNDDITHNVEYSLHPSYLTDVIQFSADNLPITAKKIANSADKFRDMIVKDTIRSNQLLAKTSILRNACIVADTKNGFVVAYLKDIKDDTIQVQMGLLTRNPFAIIECKRVGIEEGMKKGPQTIEKAKQGAYVAKSVSRLQKIRLNDGKIGGVIQRADGSLYCKEYVELIEEIINSEDKEFLRNFILTVGIVSNHGNWFTSDDHNKELKVLAQSYDWLLFLTDKGLAEFINELILAPRERYAPIKDSFLASYTGKKGKNQFTKVQMDLTAHTLLCKYFAENSDRIQSWFNTIAPVGKSLVTLKSELELLGRKNWKVILK